MPQRPRGESGSAWPPGSLGGNAQRTMLLKTASAAPVAMLKVDSLLEFEIDALAQQAQLGEVKQLDGPGVGRKV